MSGNGHDYDTAVIRAEARKLKKCMTLLSGTALPRAQSVRRKIEGRFVGKSADALESQIMKMESEMKDILDDVSGLQSALNRYANALEEADARVSDIMRG